MGKKINDEILISGMETFLKLPINETNYGGGLVKTKIGELDGRGLIYTGLEDTNINIHGKVSRGAILRRVTDIEGIKSGDLITKEAMKALSTLRGTDKEYLYDLADKINNHRLVIYPINFTKNGKDMVNIISNYNSGVTTPATMVLIRIKCKYNEKTRRCPLEYSIGTPNGNVWNTLRLQDYCTLFSLDKVAYSSSIEFSDANYVKTLVITNKKGTEKVIFDCTGIYCEKKGNLQHYKLTDSMLNFENLCTSITNALYDFGISEKLRNYASKEKLLDSIIAHKRYIIPYGCGDMRIEEVN